MHASPEINDSAAVQTDLHFPICIRAIPGGVSDADYAFTAPAVRPATMYFCAVRNTTIAGVIVTVM